MDEVEGGLPGKLGVAVLRLSLVESIYSIRNYAWGAAPISPDPLRTFLKGGLTVAT